jgi:hypothetical protein
MDVHRIIIEKKTLEGFKRRAFKAFPNEHIEAVLGRFEPSNKVRMNTLYVYAFDELDQAKSGKRRIDYFLPEEEVEAGTTLKYFGTLHTHPKTHCEPSPDDWESFLKTSQVEEQPVETYYVQILLDEVMGIMYLDKKSTKKMYGFAFYNRQGQQIEFIISEIPKRRRRGKSSR